MARFSRPSSLTRLAIGLTALAIVATASYLISIYSELPRAVPLRFSKGEPLIYQVKTPIVIMLPVLVQLSLATVIGALLGLLLWKARARDGFVGHPGDAERMSHAADGIALIGAVWIAFQSFGAFRLMQLWRREIPDFGWAYTIGVVTAVVLSVVIGARTLKLVGIGHARHAPTDPGHWRLGALYVNRRDPALFVQARSGAGWTLNFGRPVAVLLLVAVLAGGIGGPFYLAWLVMKGLLR